MFNEKNYSDTDSVKICIKINEVPLAKIWYYSGNYSNTTITMIFDASKSFDYDGVIRNYTWTFSDGSIFYEKIILREFLIGETCSVELIVKDDTSATNRWTSEFTAEYKPQFYFTHTSQSLSAIV